MSKRIVITGLGAITPLGHNVTDFATALQVGKSGIAPYTLFDDDRAKIKVAAEVKDYQAEDHFKPAQLGQLDRFSQFNLIAAREALEDAGLSTEGDLGDRYAAIFGTGIGGQNTQEESNAILHSDGGKRVHPMTVPKLMTSAAASQVSMAFGIKGPCFAVTSACASSNHAIGQALAILRSGMADVALAGGSEACITPGTLLAWQGLRVMARDTCRPFSLKRGGMVIGEGSGVLVLETEDHAKARGATIYAELAGFGMSSDAGNLVAPSADGAARAIRATLDDAKMNPDEVSYINAHGTGTPQNDPTETTAIRSVFADHADTLAISSTKSMHGHALGASGALEAVATIKAMQGSWLPPTINFIEADPKCDLDYVPNETRQMAISAALSQSLAFGGLNAVLAFRQYHD